MDNFVNTTDPKYAQSASVFKGITDEQIKKGVQKIESVSDQEIHDLVKEYGPKGQDGKGLAEKLIARKDDLAERYLGEKHEKQPWEHNGEIQPDHQKAVDTGVDAVTAHIIDSFNKYKSSDPIEKKQATFDELGQQITDMHT